MKKVSFINLLILFFTLLLPSCFIIDGAWKDNIKLSAKNVQLGAQADSVIITTRGDWWWICDITVDNNPFHDFVISPESDNYKIKQDCFTVERRDKHTLFIRLDENPLTVSRLVTVGLEAGDYFDRVKITQKGKQ